MLDFSTTVHHNAKATSICARGLAPNSQKVAAASQATFAQTLSGMTTDPNSSLVTSSAWVSQLPVAGQNSVTAPVGLSGLVPPTETVAASTAPVAAATPWYAASTADNDYWAQQPAAVQALRSMPGEAQREQLASQLASQGYSIDVPVMVWGWDAGITTQLRESAGYTWVPSATQANVTEAPGLNTPGFTPYNPANPPAGSILVG
jgi:hypothetical protein